MESKSEFPNQKFKGVAKDLMMEDLNAVDSKVTSEGNSSTCSHLSFFHKTFSRNTFKLSTIKNVSTRMQERAKNVKTSRVITLIVILTIIGIFLIPIILYYALKSDPLPESINSAFTDVNISMVSDTIRVTLCCIELYCLFI